MATRVTCTEVGIADPLPMVRSALRLAVEAAGFDTCDNPQDLAGYLRGCQHRALIVSLTGAFGLEDLDQVTQANQQATVVALLDAPSIDLYADLLRRGRAHPASRSATAESIAECLRMSLTGMCALPDLIAHQVATAFSCRGTMGLTGEELTWFRRLADGATVEKIADDSGFSERSIYRRLSAIYRKLGVTSRTEAVIYLTHAGLLGP